MAEVQQHPWFTQPLSRPREAAYKEWLAHQGKHEQLIQTHPTNVSAGRPPAGGAERPAGLPAGWLARLPYIIDRLPARPMGRRTDGRLA